MLTLRQRNTPRFGPLSEHHVEGRQDGARRYAQTAAVRHWSCAAAPGRQTTDMSHVGDSFEAAARALHRIKSGSWSKTYARQWIQRLEKDAFPWVGTFPLDKIPALQLLNTIRRVESRGACATAPPLVQQPIQPIGLVAFEMAAKAAFALPQQQGPALARVIRPCVRPSKASLNLILRFPCT